MGDRKMPDAKKTAPSAVVLMFAAFSVFVLAVMLAIAFGTVTFHHDLLPISAAQADTGWNPQGVAGQGIPEMVYASHSFVANGFAMLALIAVEIAGLVKALLAARTIEDTGKKRKTRIVCVVIAAVVVALLLGMPLTYTVMNGSNYTFWALNPWLGFSGIG